MKVKTRNLAIVIFGVIFPVLILFQAYMGINSLRNDVTYKTTISDLVSNLSDSKKYLLSANDYALYSLLYVEHANQKTMINKQVMKSTVVYIGFAVISVGMMLIILGIKEDGASGAEAAIEANGVKFDFKTGSTGVAMFCVGAIMATIGGVLKNDYQTAEIPSYLAINKSEESAEYNKSIEAYKACSLKGDNFETCFSQLFFQINVEHLK